MDVKATLYERHVPVGICQGKSRLYICHEENVLPVESKVSASCLIVGSFLVLFFGFL